MKTKVKIGHLKGDIREMRLALQCLEYAISESEKTKDPAKSLMGKKRNVLELVEEIVSHAHLMLDEIPKPGPDYEFDIYGGW